MKPRIVTAPLILVILFCTAHSADAQDRPSVGLLLGSGEAGVMWHLSDAVAIVPAVRFARAWNTPDEERSILGITTSSSSSSRSIGAAVEARWFFDRQGSLRLYVAPQYDYVHSRTTTQSTTGIDDPLLEELLGAAINRTTTSTSTTHGIQGSFGAQYALTDRFSVYGDTGARFSRTTSDLSIIGSYGIRSFGFTGSVGFVWYF